MLNSIRVPPSVKLHVLHSESTILTKSEQLNRFHQSQYLLHLVYENHLLAKRLPIWQQYFPLRYQQNSTRLQDLHFDDSKRSLITNLRYSQVRYVPNPRNAAKTSLYISHSRTIVNDSEQHDKARHYSETFLCNLKEIKLSCSRHVRNFCCVHQNLTLNVMLNFTM